MFDDILDDEKKEKFEYECPTCGTEYDGYVCPFCFYLMPRFKINLLSNHNKLANWSVDV
jgi:rubrerythrin